MSKSALIQYSFLHAGSDHKIIWMIGTIGPGTRKRALYIVNPTVTTKVRSFTSWMKTGVPPVDDFSMSVPGVVTH